MEIADPDDTDVDEAEKREKAKKSTTISPIPSYVVSFHFAYSNLDCRSHLVDRRLQVEHSKRLAQNPVESE